MGFRGYWIEGEGWERGGEGVDKIRGFVRYINKLKFYFMWNKRSINKIVYCK